MLNDLFNGALGAVRIPSFIDEALCEAAVSMFDYSLFETYDSKKYHPVVAYRFGPTLNEHNEEGTLRASYWDHAEVARRVWEEKLGGLRLRELCISKLREAWEGEVRVATVEGRELFFGILRELPTGTIVHWDDVTREYPEAFMDSAPISQLAMNVFLAAPRRGGATRVWQRKWQPTDEGYRHFFGYSEAVVDHAQPLLVRPEVGDAILFNASNYHSVDEGEGGRRVALAMFIGLTREGGLRVWS